MREDAPTSMVLGMGAVIVRSGPAWNRVIIDGSRCDAAEGCSTRRAELTSDQYLVFSIKELQ